MIDDEVWTEARKRLAAQFYQPYHINAIMSGDWDRGDLVKNKVVEVMAEQDNLPHRDIPSESCDPQPA